MKDLDLLQLPNGDWISASTIVSIKAHEQSADAKCPARVVVGTEGGGVSIIYTKSHADAMQLRDNIVDTLIAMTPRAQRFTLGVAKQTESIA